MQQKLAQIARWGTHGRTSKHTYRPMPASSIRAASVAAQSSTTVRPSTVSTRQPASTPSRPASPRTWRTPHTRHIRIRADMHARAPPWPLGLTLTTNAPSNATPIGPFRNRTCRSRCPYGRTVRIRSGSVAQPHAGAEPRRLCKQAGTGLSAYFFFPFFFFFRVGLACVGLGCFGGCVVFFCSAVPFRLGQGTISPFALCAATADGCEARRLRSIRIRSPL